MPQLYKVKASATLTSGQLQSSTVDGVKEQAIRTLATVVPSAVEFKTKAEDLGDGSFKVKASAKLTAAQVGVYTTTPGGDDTDAVKTAVTRALSNVVPGGDFKVKVEAA